MFDYSGILIAEVVLDMLSQTLAIKMMWLLPVHTIISPIWLGMQEHRLNVTGCISVEVLLRRMRE